MISDAELRQIIESAFLPLDCRCSFAADGTLSILVRAVDCDHDCLAVQGIKTAPLVSIRAVSNLIAELRIQLRDDWECRRRTLP